MIDAITLRHKIHQNPELAFNEFKTQELLIKSITALGYTNILKIAKTGVLVEITNTPNTPYIVFRADIDALNIKEETNCEFKSKNNYMHACGHDVHTAILYDFLIKIKNINFNSNLLIIFQPAEEAESGGKLVAKYLKQNYNIKHAFALHVTDEYPLGYVATKPGILFSSSIEFDIIIKGEEGHIAFSKNKKNAIYYSSLFLTKLFNLLKNTNILAGIGKISGGSARNILPKEVKIEGTLRSHSLGNALKNLENIKKLINSFSLKHKIEIKLQQGVIYPEVFVDNELFKLFKQIIPEDKFILCETKYTAEDFGYYSREFPSLMFWLGTALDNNIYGLHSNKFLPPDGIINKGSNIFIKILKKISLNII